jgi:hypothetical protein
MSKDFAKKLAQAEATLVLLLSIPCSLSALVCLCASFSELRDANTSLEALKLATNVASVQLSCLLRDRV